MGHIWQALGWLVPGAGLCALVYYRKIPARRVALALGVWLWVLVLGQVVLAFVGGYATLKMLLPLHLCSAMAFISAWMLVRWDERAFKYVFYLGWPGALLALAIPVYGSTPWPAVEQMMFTAIHAAIVTAPFLMMAGGVRPRRRDAWIVLLFGNVLLLASDIVNTAIDANYMFLRYPPSGTPLAWMAANGKLGYLAALELCTLLLLKVLSIIAGRVSKGRRLA